MSSSSKDKMTATETTEKNAMTEFKRSGAFDRIRKETLRNWEASAEGEKFRAGLKKIVMAEVERDPSLLARDRGKAATLVGGSVERSQLYPDAKMAAVRQIFQSEAFKMRVYESIKQYFPNTEKLENGEKPASETDAAPKNAQQAAMDFIQREGGA